MTIYRGHRNRGQADIEVALQSCSWQQQLAAAAVDPTRSAAPARQASNDVTQCRLQQKLLGITLQFLSIKKYIGIFCCRFLQ